MQERKRVYLSPPQLSGKEIEYVREALESNWVAPVGPFLNRFEEALGRHAGVKHVLATNSGTAAIHLALLAIGVEKGDEVLCSTLTFVGSANPILYCGAVPVFIDSETETWNMDPDLLEEAIKDRLNKTGKLPKAIIVVHLYGMPAQMDRIMAIAKRYGIPVVEDAAEAVGSVYHGRQAGSLGDIGVYSFNGNKIMTTSGGGALLSDNLEWITKARYLANQAKENVEHFEHNEVGFNYALSNISAAIGLAQLETIGERVQSRRENNEFYRGHFSGFRFQDESEGVYSNFWLSACLLGDEEQVRHFLDTAAMENIEVRRIWKPLHNQKAFESSLFYSSGVADELFSKGICLPYCPIEQINHLASRFKRNTVG